MDRAFRHFSNPPGYILSCWDQRNALQLFFRRRSSRGFLYVPETGDVVQVFIERRTTSHSPQSQSIVPVRLRFLQSPLHAVVFEPREGNFSRREGKTRADAGRGWL